MPSLFNASLRLQGHFPNSPPPYTAQPSLDASLRRLSDMPIPFWAARASPSSAPSPQSSIVIPHFS